MNDPGMIISYDELKILLYNRGFRSCIGILMPADQRSDKEILLAMNKLAQKGIIIAQEDAFVIDSNWIAVIDLIGRPDSSYSFTVPETGQLYYCYIAENLIVVTEKYWKKKDTLLLRRFTPAEFQAWREELEKE